MNKLLIGLLIVAAGTGAFFLLRKKKQEPVTTELKKEWIIGQWKSDAIVDNDSNFNKYRFDFQSNGSLLRSLNDSTGADTVYYEWSKTSELVWKEKATDSVGKNFTVLQLTPDSLQVQGKDSVKILFTKLK
jgi:hypothetical protein